MVSGIGSMSGFVYDADVQDNGQTRIAGALITVSDESTRFQETTNQEGIYSIRGIPAGEYNFTCSKEGYETVRSGERKMIIEAGKDRAGAVGMHRAPPVKEKFKLVGKVISRTNPNEFISGAEIKVSWTSAGVTYNKEGETGERKTLGQFQDINFEINDIPLFSQTEYNLFQITIDHPEYESYSSSFTVDTSKMNYFWDLSSYIWRIDSSLAPRPNFTIFGMVVEKKPRAGFPIFNAEVSVELVKLGRSQKTYSINTDKYGKYNIDGVAYDKNFEYILKVKHPDYRDITERFTLSSFPQDGKIEKNFQLLPDYGDCSKVCPRCQ